MKNRFKRKDYLYKNKSMHIHKPFPSWRNLFGKILLIFLFFQVTANAQKVTWSQPFTEDKKMQYLKIIGMDEKGFYLLRSNRSLDNGNDRSGSRNKKYVLEYFDLDMRQKWTQPLTSSIADAKIIAVQSVNDKVLVLSAVTEKQTKRYSIFAQYMNNKGSYELQPLLLDELCWSHRC